MLCGCTQDPLLPFTDYFVTLEPEKLPQLIGKYVSAKEGKEKQYNYNFIMCFIVYKSLKVHYVL